MVLKKFHQENISLENIRDIVRDKLYQSYPTLFQKGQMAVLYPPPRSPSRLQAVRVDSEDSLRTVRAVRVDSEDSPRTVRAVRAKSKHQLLSILLGLCLDTRTALGIC